MRSRPSRRRSGRRSRAASPTGSASSLCAARRHVLAWALPTGRRHLAPVGTSWYCVLASCYAQLQSSSPGDGAYPCCRSLRPSSARLCRWTAAGAGRPSGCCCLSSTSSSGQVGTPSFSQVLRCPFAATCAWHDRLTCVTLPPRMTCNWRAAWLDADMCPASAGYYSDRNAGNAIKELEVGHAGIHTLQ